ncbi:hypothetical protein LTR10_006128 [Elasticomyces elasticus]|nr:hypothetical protein LTR10_006128 [Elasticomyces elasticus]KAK4966821.1 hypothetical protein LTR42_011133 [Elasticomyces elasticus]
MVKAMADANTTKKKKRAVKSKKAVPLEPVEWQPPPAKRPDIFMTLPPELRNVIYADVLKDKSPITMLPADLAGTDYNGRQGPWREPALLQVSKAIRSEATSIYYGDNDFNIVVPLSRGSELCAKLRRLTQRCGPRPFRSLRILFSNAYWKYMAEGHLLGMLFYDTGLQAHPVFRTEGCVRDRYSQNVHVINSGCRTIEAVLRVAVELGQKGARESWSNAEMSHRYVEWARLCVTAKTKRTYSNAWVKAKAALLA